MSRHLIIGLLVSTVCAAPASAQTPSPETTATADCRMGVYRAADGRALGLARNGDGFGYVHVDGRTGVIGHPLSPVSCGPGVVNVKLPSGEVETWPAVGTRITPTQFRSGNETLAGLLVEGAATSEAKPPLVVVAHGSGRESWTKGELLLQFNLAAQGVSVFVFDKRGTGESTGQFTMDFDVLAEDLVAAATEAKRMTEGRRGRFGLYGFSQGGWLAPMAAERAGAEFVAVGYGALYSPIEEDAEEVAEDLRAYAFGEEAIRRARDITDATGALVRSRFTSGFENFARVKAQYQGEPWFRLIKGDFSGRMLTQDEAELRANGPANFYSLGIPWDHDSMSVMRTVDVPQLWVVPAGDQDLPPVLTLERLEQLQAEGRPIDVAIFPGAIHGLGRYVQTPDGGRDAIRAVEGWFQLLGDWVKGGQGDTYGAAVLIPRQPPAS